MTRNEIFNQAETKAAHAAAEVFMETLRAELEKAGGVGTVMEALGTTMHVHTALVVGERPGVIVYGFRFDESPEAVAKARAEAGLVAESKNVTA